MVEHLSYLGVFIHPSSCSLRSATESLVVENFLACFNMLAKCLAYSVGSPHVAGRDAEHLG